MNNFMNNLIFSTHPRVKNPAVVYNKFVHEKQEPEPEIKDPPFEGTVIIDPAKLFGGIEPTAEQFRDAPAVPAHPLRVGMMKNIENGKKCGTCGLGARTIILYNGKLL